MTAGQGDARGCTERNRRGAPGGRRALRRAVLHALGRAYRHAPGLPTVTHARPGRPTPRPAPIDAPSAAQVPLAGHRVLGLRPLLGRHGSCCKGHRGGGAARPGVQNGLRCHTARGPRNEHRPALPGAPHSLLSGLRPHVRRRRAGRGRLSDASRAVRLPAQPPAHQEVRRRQRARAAPALPCAAARVRQGRRKRRCRGAASRQRSQARPPTPAGRSSSPPRRGRQPAPAARTSRGGRGVAGPSPPP